MTDYQTLIATATKTLADFAQEASDQKNNYLSVVGVLFGRGDERVPIVRLVDEDDPSTSRLLASIVLRVFQQDDDFGEDPRLAIALSRIVSSPDPQDPEFSTARFYYLHIQGLSAATPRIAVFALADRPSSGDLLPLGLRILASYLRYQLFLARETDTIGVYAAMAAGYNEKALELAVDMVNAGGAILWSYDFKKQQYRAVEQFGRNDETYILPLGGVRERESVEGIVAQVRPEREIVVFDMDHLEVRIPNDLPGWAPHDPSVMERNGWRSCVAWPIAVGGELLGALSFYASTLEELRFDPLIRSQISPAFFDHLRAISANQSIREIEEAYESELARTSSGAIATEFIHDFKKHLSDISNAFKVVRIPSDQVGNINLVAEARASTKFLQDLVSSLAILATGREPRPGHTVIRDFLIANRTFLERVATNENKDVLVEIHPGREASGISSTRVPIGEFPLMRVLINLLRNAAYWTKSVDHPRIDVWLESGSPSSRSGVSPLPVVLRVEDNGVGIPDSDLGQIFARGFTQREYDGGTGLGLHIVRHAVEEAGGKVRASSRKNKSTNITIELPVA
jgi:signal transduction histidine kinase